jgi:hypothetical protein
MPNPGLQTGIIIVGLLFLGVTPMMTAPLPPSANKSPPSGMAKGSVTDKSMLYKMWSMPKPKGDLRTMNAYDCTVPLGMEAVQRPEPPACRAEPIPVERQATEMLLLQRAHSTRLTAYRCTKLETVLPLYCGNADHQTLATPLVQLQLQMDRTVSQDQCQTWKDTQKYIHHPWKTSHGNEFGTQRHHLGLL